MNKIENFLNNLIDGGKNSPDEFVLAYFFEDLDLMITFAREANLTDCLLVITSLKDISFKTQCYFNLPCCHILNFLNLHTQSDELNNNGKHWLIKENSVSIDFEQIIDPLYEKLFQTIQNSPVEAVQSKIFKNKLEKALSVKSDLPSKKPKI